MVKRVVKMVKIMVKNNGQKFDITPNFCYIIVETYCGIGGVWQYQ